MLNSVNTSVAHKQEQENAKRQIRLNYCFHLDFHFSITFFLWQLGSENNVLLPLELFQAVCIVTLNILWFIWIVSFIHKPDVCFECSVRFILKIQL